MRKILIGNSQGETVQGVYRRTKGVFQDAAELLHALDVLFVLGVLTIEDETGLITYA
ncbi:ABC-three component system middle component 7 [Variovorax sp. CCNWLW235]